VSVCEHIMCFEAFGEVLKVLLQGGNVRFLSFLIRRYVARLLFCVTSRSFIFVNTLDLV
jgi:hypothetical protein